MKHTISAKEAIAEYLAIDVKDMDAREVEKHGIYEIGDICYIAKKEIETPLKMENLTSWKKVKNN